MVQHILPKGFQRIRYSSLQVTCILTQVLEQLAVGLAIAIQRVLDMVSASLKQRGYRERLQTTLECDSLMCLHCGGHVVVADLASAV